MTVSPDDFFHRLLDRIGGLLDGLLGFPDGLAALPSREANIKTAVLMPQPKRI